MKTRTDYVTNSSSSSFIIAKKEECTIKEIADKIREMDQALEEVQRWDNMDDVELEIFILEAAERLYRIPSDLKLDRWFVSAAEYSSDDESFECFVYLYGHLIETENFKIQSCW